MRSTVKPVVTYTVTADVTHASNRAITDIVVSSIFSTSSVNNTPPIGALNIPAMPAPAPQPIIIIISLGSRRHRRPILLPTAPPAYAIGPSEPADPPIPSVTVLVSTGVKHIDNGMSYRCLLSTLPSLRDGCSRFWCNTYRCNMPVNNMPATGTISSIQFAPQASICDVINCVR
ncbi:MAG: hypothetical protein Q4C34_07995 [Bacteroidales bacterium]|nr:hypothetical protein [Bacteroidales bacterium]